jgi:hypothetical protein
MTYYLMMIIIITGWLLLASHHWQYMLSSHTWTVSMVKHSFLNHSSGYWRLQSSHNSIPWWVSISNEWQPAMFLVMFSYSLSLSLSFSISLVQQCNVGQGCPILEVSISHTTAGRTPVDEGSARHSDLHLTTHNTRMRQTSMPPVGFEPAIPASKWPQAHALHCSATGIGFWSCIYQNIWLVSILVFTFI